MASKFRHGSDGQQIWEVKPPQLDRLPDGVPDDAGPGCSDDRDDRGRFAGGNALSSKGGRSRRGTTALSHSLGLDGLAAREDFRPFLRAAKAWRKRIASDIAASAGGGTCSAMVSTIIQTAAMQQAASAYLFAKAGEDADPKVFATAARLGDSARQNILACWELASREAKAREGAGFNETITALCGPSKRQ